MLFTIAIPAYKSKFLKECIDSILAQTYTHFELIIVNDCSPEPVDSIVSQFTDTRISYYKNEVNLGAENLVKNWNNALAKASGEFFMMMGDDDRLEPNYLEEFVSLIKKYDTLDVFHCRSKIIDEHSDFIQLTPSWPEYESVYDSIWHRINNYRLQYISDFVYRTEVLKRNGGFFDIPLAWASDDITAYIASIGKGIAHTNNPVFNYRQTRYTITSSGNSELKMKAILIEHNWFKTFLKSKPTHPNDLIVYTNLCEQVDGYINVKKLATLTASLKGKLFSGAMSWYKNREKYHLSTSTIVKAVLKRLKLIIRNKDNR